MFERVLQVFKTVFEDTVDTANITPDSHLKEDIGINSIGMLYMAMALEEEFGVKFVNEDLVSLTTVADVMRCIEGKL